MEDLRVLLCENEDVLAQFCKKQGIKYSSATKKNYFRELKHDGDLLHYVMTSMSSSDMKSFAQIAHENNYQTCLDIINDYFTSLNLDDYLDIRSLKQNEEYSTYEIAAMAQKYNIVVGMQYVERNDSRYVIIKSTLENEKSKQGYHDHWITPGKTLCYYMQKENPENVKHFSFSYQPNRQIFDSIFNNATEPLDIFVFSREREGAPYTYQGIFHSIGTAEDGRAFTLGNASVSPYDPAIAKVRQQFEQRFEEESPSSVVRRKKRLICAEPPTPAEIKAFADRVPEKAFISERDYIYEAKLRQKIGDLGEEAVWEYEKAKIRKALAHDPNFAEELIGTMAWVSKEPGGEKYGYDIRSYNILNGHPIPIFIEVKTTTSNSSKDFYITEHELQTARSEAINQNYYIYRVYNINSDQPLFYFMKGDPANFYKLSPFIWLAKIR